MDQEWCNVVWEEWSLSFELCSLERSLKQRGELWLRSWTTVMLGTVWTAVRKSRNTSDSKATFSARNNAGNPSRPHVDEWLAEEKEETGEAEKQNEPQGKANPCAVSLNCSLSIPRPNVECAKSILCEHTRHNADPNPEHKLEIPIPRKHTD